MDDSPTDFSEATFDLDAGLKKYQRNENHDFCSNWNRLTPAHDFTSDLLSALIAEKGGYLLL